MNFVMIALLLASTLILDPSQTPLTDEKSPLKYITSQEGPKVFGPYSPAVVASNLVFVSGQLPIDPKSGKKFEETIQEATRQAIANMRSVLLAAGSDLDLVVRVDVVLKDVKDLVGLNEEYAKHFSQGKQPSRQIITADIPARLELSCIAIAK